MCVVSVSVPVNKHNTSDGELHHLSIAVNKLNYQLTTEGSNDNTPLASAEGSEHDHILKYENLSEGSKHFIW